MAPPYQGRERTWRFKLDETTVLEVSTETPAKRRVRPRGRFRILGALVVALTLLTVIFTAGAAAEGTPSIASDKADYLPGEAVALSGSGWVAGEVVHVTVDDDQSDPWTHEADLTAADDGTFAGALTLPEVAGTYTVMATAPSGTAAATFTVTAPAPPPPPPPPPSGGPAIVSDKADYAPGDTVALSGSGWVAGEIVHVTVDDDQSDPRTHEADVTAAADGTLSDSFDLTELAGTFAVSATAPSGSADTSFTVTAQPPAPTTDPTLSSNRDAYPPGETVTLTGADWTAGGTVHVAVDDDKNDAWEHSADVTVAANGTITDTFDLPDGLAAAFTATATDPADRSATATFSAGFGSATEPYLVRFASGTTTETQAQILAAAGAVDTNYIAPLRIHGVLLPGGAGLQTSLDKLRSYPSVTRVEPDRTREAGGTPNDSNYGDQWSLTKIGWENVFGTVSPSGSAKVAILDTGIDGSHPDLDGNVVSGTSILDGSNGLSDPNGHGTAMAGIVAAETNNGAGVAGVGYAGVQVMPVTVLGADGTGQDSEIIEGAVYAADNGADVILMAFSNPGYSEMLQAAIDYAWESGAVLVAATGNDGSSSVTFPAGDRGVVGVSNTDQSDALNGSSNYGQAVFLGAPGTGIATTSAGGGYTSITGTSAAAAEVAGAAALISAASGASNGVIVSRLAKNAEPAGTQEQTGNGRLNVDRAIADESTDSIQPSGANPVGSGGPIVGPYAIAAINLNSVSNESDTEGDTGTKTLTFDVDLTGSGTPHPTLYWRTQDGTAAGGASCGSGIDYVSVSQTAGQSKSADFTIDVTICGDTAFEADETFTLQVADNAGFLAGGGNRLRTGTGTIVNDDAANTPPSGTDKTITVNEDASYTFATTDFGFTDPNAGDTMSAVRIDTLSIPAGASLKLSGSNVTAGQVILTADIPNLVFTPAPNASGAGYASFTFSVRDTNGPAFDPTPNTMTIDVTPVNDPPVAVNDAYDATEDTPLSVNAADGVLANDTDVDGDALTAVLVSGPPNALSFTLNAEGSFDYTPNANFCENDSFTYKANDGEEDSNVATVTIDVECVNDDPVANDDTATVTEDSGANTINVLGNDTDVDGDTLSVSAVTQPANGTVVNNGTDVSYEPNPNYCNDPPGTTPDTFTYTASDGNGGTDTADVSVTVTCVNDDPVANDDTATVTEDSGANTINVLGNDTDVDGDTLSVSAVTQPANGTVVNNGTDVSYEPNPNYCNDPPGTTPDTFTYTASDGNGGTDTADVSVTVTCVNDDPVANDDTATVTEDSGANTINVLGNDTDVDGDTLSVSAVTQPANGTVVNNGTDVSYEPNPNYCNDPPGTTPDTFTYTASDGNGGTDTADVSVTVTCVNDDPVANDDTATVTEDSGANTINVLGNDTDVDGDTLSVSAVTQPANGTVVNNGTDVSYEPNPNYCNDPPGTTPDTFTYTASDGNGGTDTADVSVTVTCVNDDPVANDDTATVTEDSGANTINVLGNDTDVDGDTLSVSAVTQPANGTVVNNGTDVSYEPNPNYCNDPPGTTPDTFTYTASDGNGGTDTADVSVTVTCVNDDPVANDDTATVTEDSGANTINVLGNDTDVDGDTLSVSAVTQPANGTVVNNGTDVSYEPNPNYCNDPPGTTPDTFTYTASDGNGGTDTADVSVTVTCVNDDPVANDDTATVTEDSGANTINVLGNDTDVDGDTLSVSAVTQPANGTVVNNGTDVSYEPNPNYCNDPPGTTPDTFTYTASDGNGGTDTADVSVTVTCVNDAPDVDAGPNVSGAEGSPISLNGDVSDVEGDSFTVAWTYTAGAGVDAGATCEFDDATEVDTAITCTDDGTYTATLTATDSQGAPGSDSTTVTVSNANPEVTINSPNEDTAPASVGTVVNVNATFTDAGVNDTHTAPGGQCVIDWDDGTTSIGTVTEVPQSGSGSCTGSHAYTSLGVYMITVTVTDDDGGSGSDTAQFVIFDPNAGFVTGGGWIMVQPGSYTLNAVATGKGNFGFVSKYKPGASTPSGETEFNFNTAAFKFHSETYKVLLVAGFKAQYTGTGRVNGESGYDFRLTAYDGQINGGGGVDKFRIKIRKNGVTIFDNRITNPSDDMETANPQEIGGGSIVIHKGK